MIFRYFDKNLMTFNDVDSMSLEQFNSTLFRFVVEKFTSQAWPTEEAL